MDTTEKRESTGLKYLNDLEAFIEYSNDNDKIYKNIERYKWNKNGILLIVFDDMIDDMHSNKKINPIETKLFISGIKLYRNLYCCIEKY